MLDPHKQLEFDFQPSTSVSSKISMKNISKNPIAFKVRTTAPKSYLVKPSQGILLSDESKMLLVIMHPTVEYPGEISHKFMIQAINTVLNFNYSPQEFNDAWEMNKNQAVSTKLKVKINEDIKKDVDKYEDCSNSFEAEKYQILKHEIEKLSHYNFKLELKQNNMENKLKYFRDEIQREDQITQRIASQSPKDNNLFYFVISLAIGVLVGYLNPLK